MEVETRMKQRKTKKKRKKNIKTEQVTEMNKTNGKKRYRNLKIDDRCKIAHERSTLQINGLFL